MSRYVSLTPAMQSDVIHAQEMADGYDTPGSIFASMLSEVEVYEVHRYDIFCT